MLEFGQRDSQFTMLDPDELFGAFLLVACLWEERLTPEFRLEEQPFPVFTKLYPILLARVTGSNYLSRVERVCSD